MMQKVFVPLIGVLVCLAVILLLDDPTTFSQGSDDCTNIPTIALDASASGRTDEINATPLANDHDCGRGHRGPDVVYRLHINSYPTPTVLPGTPVPTIKVNLNGYANFDADWSVAGTCDKTGGDIGCWDTIFSGEDLNPTPTAGSGTPTCTPRPDENADLWGKINVSVGLLYDTDYFVWVDGNADNDAGEYHLLLTQDFQEEEE
jgi:hypothetical protein